MANPRVVRDRATRYPRHAEATALVPAAAGAVFAHLDAHSQLAAHMSARSWMLGGGSMTLELDAAAGRELGARMHLGGRVFGCELAVDEIVVTHDPPLRKVWETVGTPRLLIISGYRMGFELCPLPAGTELRIFIDYAVTGRGPARWAATVLARWYARWCTQRMVGDTIRHFKSR